MYSADEASAIAYDPGNTRVIGICYSLNCSASVQEEGMLPQSRVSNEASS